MAAVGFSPEMRVMTHRALAYQVLPPVEPTAAHAGDDGPNHRAGQVSLGAKV